MKKAAKRAVGRLRNAMRGALRDVSQGALYSAPLFFANKRLSLSFFAQYRNRVINFLRLLFGEWLWGFLTDFRSAFEEERR